MKFIVILSICLISCSETLSPEEEKQLVKYHAAKGTIKWSWEMKPFCQSQSTTGERIGFYRSAYIRQKDIMFESVNCARVQMDVLHCEYIIMNPDDWTQEWRREMYVNDLQGSVFTLQSLPKTSKCYTFPIDAVYYKIPDGKFEPITTREDLGTSSLRRELFGTNPRHRDEILVEYYKGGGVVKWKYEMKPFCSSQDSRLSFDSAHLETQEIMIERVNCAIIQIEVLICEYVHAYNAQNASRHRQYYANDMFGEVYFLQLLPRYSHCTSATPIKIMKQIVNRGERLPITTREVQKNTHLGEASHN